MITDLNDSVKVSVITPTYCRPEYLADAIESVLGQTYRNIEYIIVDDNKPDSEERKFTEEIVGRFADERIRYIRNAVNMGGSKARNEGISAATGKYTVFLDDDDVYLPERIEKQLYAAETGGWDVCVMDMADYDYTSGKMIGEKRQRVRTGMSRDELMKVHLISHITGTNTFMFRTDYLKKIGGFTDAPSCQEFLLMYKAIEAGPRFGYVPEILVKNRMHPGTQISTGRRKLEGLDMMMSAKKAYFHLLSNKERRDVVSRHYATKAFVYARMHKVVKAAISGFVSIAVSPLNALAILKNNMNKLKR